MSGTATDRYLARRNVPSDRMFRGTQVMPRELLPTPSGTRAHPRRYILFLGYLRPEKGVDLLLRAFRDVSGELDLVIAGSGPQEARLRALAAGNERILFVGHVDGPAKADLLAGAAALVVPSHYEPWGLVVNEALHYGVPVVCSTAVAARDLLDERSAIVVADGDEAALRAALTRIAAGADEHLRAGARAVDARRISDPEYGVTHFVAALEAAFAADRT